MMRSEQFGELWVDKYRPTKLDDYILNPDIKAYFRDMLDKKSLQNFTMCQAQGSGKTSLALVICNELNAEVLFVKCAQEGTIDTLRGKVAEFCNSLSIEGKPKIVILDELDSASQSGDSNFQKGLRTLIEASQASTRFILTANYNKIIPAVLSRCPLIPLSFDKRDLLLHVKKILDLEQIKYDKESLKKFVEDSFNYYPDVRRIINYLQFCCNSGTLIVKLNAAANSDVEQFLEELVKLTCDTSQNILSVRQYYVRQKDKIADYVTFASELFNFVIDNNILTDMNGILKLSDQIHQLNVVVDKEPTFFAMLVTIRKYVNGR